ncbi:DUF3037 domain-containing protein [uncultured Thiodictyon sp.]|uniref:DUF3037 domain-containing protein n=1 Tax=uncultured Thiodictyon sp. TaxID=1846217 RepID=UPI0025DE85B9|nr:DUF3037 domain-containing protein [uncultured Thiodictyon sp.]
MTKTACQYAIIRFAPFVETDEFANVGIVLLAPRAGFFGHRLEARRYARITRFFEGLDGRTYKAAVSTVSADLQRLSHVLTERGFGPGVERAGAAFAQDVFHEIVRPREGIVRYSDPRVVMADDPATTLNHLFSRYVERDFATPEYHETAMERALRALLQGAHLAARFESWRIGDDGYHVTFPLVEHRGETPVRAIKALNLAQDEPSKIRDHALLWRGRINMLRERRTLPDRVLFAVSEPGSERAQKDAYDEALADFQRDGVQAVSARDSKRVLLFAST